MNKQRPQRNKRPHHTREIVVNANRKHRGLVTLRFDSTDHTGAQVGQNGIRWHVPSR